MLKTLRAELLADVRRHDPIDKFDVVWDCPDNARAWAHALGIANPKSGGGPPQQMSAASKAQMADTMATQAILRSAQPLIQPTVTGSIAGTNTAQGQTLNIPLNNVGLNTKITLEISGAIAAASTEVMMRTGFGLSNILTNITLTDLSNFQRVNTTGFHLFLLGCMRRAKVYGAAYQNDSPVFMGSSFPVMTAPAVVNAASGTINFRIFFEIPLAFHDHDLRGSIWANVTGAQWRLGFTVNPTIVGKTGTDPINSAWLSNSSSNIGNITSFAYTVYQHYYDQLPVSGNAQILPTLSLAYNYMLINTVGSTALSQSNDNPVQYSNFRTYYSTVAIYDNNGVYNTRVRYQLHGDSIRKPDLSAKIRSLHVGAVDKELDWRRSSARCLHFQPPQTTGGNEPIRQHAIRAQPIGCNIGSTIVDAIRNAGLAVTGDQCRLARCDVVHNSGACAQDRERALKTVIPHGTSMLFLTNCSGCKMLNTIQTWFTAPFSLANMTPADWFRFFGILILISIAWGMIIRTSEEII